MQEKDYKNLIWANDIVAVGEDYYFSCLNYNGLYCLHMPKKQLEFLGLVPGEEYYKRYLYGSIIEVDGKLYMPPMNSEEIAVYDIKQRKFEKIALRYECNKGSKFLGALYSNRKIFFIPCRYHYLVVLNLDSGQITYLDEWYHMLLVPDEYDEPIIRNGFFIKDSVLYMASMVDNTLIEISTNNFETKHIKIGSDSMGFVDMRFDIEEKCIWFLKKNKPVVVRWDLESFQTRSYEVVHESYKQKGKYPFIRLIYDKNRIYLVAYQSNISVMMNKNENIFLPAEWDTDDNKDIYREWGAKYYFAKKLAEDIFAVGKTGELSIIKQGKTVDRICLRDLFIEFRYNCQKGRFIKENEGFNIIDFIEATFIRQKTKYDNNGLEVLYGQEIYQTLKGNQ